MSGTFTGTLGVGEKIQVSVDGSTWIDATAGAGTFSAAGETLRRAARRSRWARSTRRATLRPAGHSYTLETAGPTAVATVTALSSDSGTAGDFITNVASQTVSGTFTGTLGVGEKIQVSVDGSTWIDATAGAGTFSAAGVTLTAGGTTLSVRTIDTAGNITAGTGHSYTLETAGPTAVATVTALSSDSGTAGDFITNVASQTVSGTFTGTLGSARRSRSAWMVRPGLMRRRVPGPSRPRA